MDYDEVVLGRRSIRGYKPDPVPRRVIEQVLELATRAPSSMNTQPWHFFVVSGEPLENIRAGNTERNLAGVPDSREFRAHGPYEGVHRDRQIEIAVQLFQAMGIERHDKEGRHEYTLAGAGLDLEHERQRFAAYEREYGIEPELNTPRDA